ncbi:MAG: class I SAM-dependent methyltransferase [Desulfamplus sp.]|nr:class I SAM-dependent methyltransferase [Desulfamplus sp.]
MKEHDIRPEKLHDRYLELSAHDAEKCFRGCEKRDILCVGCGGRQLQFQFEKNGFPYSLCEECGSLFQSPRPSISAFEKFYRESESSQYWAESFFPAVAEARRDKVFKSRVKRLSDLCETKGLDAQKIVDVGAGYGIFLEEWRNIYPDVNAIAIEPSQYLANECRSKNLVVLEDIVENIEGYDNYADLVICFEVLEHVYEPLSFIQTLMKLVRPGGYVFLSTLCVDGFDIQMLWENSKSIFPPHHINFLSIRGFEQLFGRAGLTEINITTPGQLDVDIVRNSMSQNHLYQSNHRFFSKMIDNSKQAASFQQFLTDNCLSSHAWVMGKKPNN